MLPAQPQQSLSLKLLLLGGSAEQRGRFLQDSGQGNISGLNSKTREVEVDGKKVNMQAWYMSGQDKVAAGPNTAQIMVVLCDLSTKTAYQEAQKIVSKIDDNTRASKHVVLVGLTGPSDEVTPDEFIRYANEQKNVAFSLQSGSVSADAQESFYKTIARDTISKLNLMPKQPQQKPPVSGPAPAPSSKGFFSSLNAVASLFKPAPAVPAAAAPQPFEISAPRQPAEKTEQTRIPDVRFYVSCLSNASDLDNIIRKKFSDTFVGAERKNPNEDEKTNLTIEYHGRNVKLINGSDHSPITTNLCYSVAQAIIIICDLSNQDGMDNIEKLRDKLKSLPAEARQKTILVACIPPNGYSQMLSDRFLELANNYERSQPLILRGNPSQQAGIEKIFLSSFSKSIAREQQSVVTLVAPTARAPQSMRK